jgi:PAS domain-containing protein
MRKHTQKTASSVPPDWHRQEVEGMIRGWLGDRKKRGYGRDPDFMDWAAKTAENAKETLIHLLRKYRIQPFEILEILALYKTEEWFHTHINIRKKLRNAPLREKDATSLEKAAQILEQWRSYLIQQTHALEWDEYPEIAQLNLVAKTLRGFGPSHRHRAIEVRLRCCAQRLADEFLHHTAWKNPLYEHIGVLMKSAFQQDWGAAGDLREAAKKMVKGWDYQKRWIDERNYPIWIIDNELNVVHINQPAGRILGTLPWKLAGKNVALLLKALVVKIRTNDRNAAGDFERDYLKFLKHQLKGYGFEWKTTLTLEREVTNKFYENEKQIVDYDFLVQREIPRPSDGTRSYLTEKQSTPSSDGTTAA